MESEPSSIRDNLVGSAGMALMLIVASIPHTHMLYRAETLP